MPESAPAKICIICREDCSHKARTKDKQGRYTCEECLTKARRSAPEKREAPAPVATAPSDDDGAIPFLEEEAPASKPKMIPCPNCARPLASDTIICMGCGFNRTTGKNVATLLGQDATESGGQSSSKGKKAKSQRICRSCGYDMNGLNTLTCPECGTVNPRPTRRDRDREDSRRVARNAWIQPLIMTAVGLSITCLMVGAVGGASAVVGQLMAFGVSLFIGLVVYVMCSIVWIGFDEPLPMTAIRLMGVYALADIGFTAVGLLPLGIGLFGMGFWTAASVIYVLLLAHIMELDLVDAIIVSVVTTIAKIFIVGFIIAWLSGLI